MKSKTKALIILAAVLAVFFVWYGLKTPSLDADWQTPLAVQSEAEFNGDIVTIKNVRNFRYVSETDFTPSYYNQDYDLAKIFKVWYVVEPFKAREYAAHTFLSFEFSDGKFITISIEARKKKGQDYSIILGAFKTYPLVYIAADERDAIYMRTNTRQNKVYLYPVKASPEQVKLLFVDMLKRMNQLGEKPEWYNTFTANCTSAIAHHVNKIWPGKLPRFLWQAWVTGYAEKLAFKTGLIDTRLSLEQARGKYYVTEISNQIGPKDDYSLLLRNF